MLQFLVNNHPLPLQPPRPSRCPGIWSDYRDCHFWPDLLLIYAKPSPDLLRLVETRFAQRSIRLNIDAPGRWSARRARSSATSCAGG